MGVHERCQRCGYGKQLFEAMLARERTMPSRLGYDRPSHKFLAFLNRHYGLKHYRPQSNNFVVFERYFFPEVDADSRPEFMAEAKNSSTRPSGSKRDSSQGRRSS